MRLRPAKFDLKVLYKKGKDNQHDDALSILLTGSPTVEDDEGEIAWLLNKGTEADLHLDTIDINATVDFMEQCLEEFDHVLAMKEPKYPQLEHITVEKFIA